MGCGRVFTSSDISEGKWLLRWFARPPTEQLFVLPESRLRGDSERRNEHLAGVLSPTWGRCYFEKNERMSFLSYPRGL